MNLDPNEIARSSPFEMRYKLLRRRWSDGPHESWEASDLVLDREVVVNRAYRQHGNPALIRRAKAGAMLIHPMILPVFDLGVTGEGLAFFTTPPSRAVPLDDRLRRLDEGDDPAGTPFPLGPVVSVVRDACRAVEHLHRHGFLHLDLYPGALLVGEGFRGVLLDHDRHDWKEREGDKGKGDGGFVCRPVYASPEQVDLTADVGPATDVFGLGGILHFILFGTPPNHLPGEVVAWQLIRAIANRSFEPRRPGTLRPGVRSSSPRRQVDSLIAICLKALAFEPEARYPTAGDMGDALDGWLHEARPARQPWPWRWMSSRSEPDRNSVDG